MNGDYKKVPLIIGFTINVGANSLQDVMNESLGLKERVDNGVSPTLFKSFISKLADAQNIG